MPLRDDILNPIAGENPSGADLRYDPLYDKVKEARRQDDDLNQGAWQRERKVADYPLVIKLCQEAIATRSKDLQLAAWLSEALLKTRSFGGLAEGLTLCENLLVNFWDTLYPEIEDGDLELRAAPLDWIGGKLEVAVRMTPLTTDGYNYFQYKESRTLGYEDQAKTDAQKKSRSKLLNEGKIAPEVFDKSLAETSKAFYFNSEKDLDACLAAIGRLDQLCEEKFEDQSPTFGKLKEALGEVRHLVHGFLQKKRETDPDPVEEVAPEASAEPAEAAAAAAAGAGGDVAAAMPLSGAPSLTFSARSASEPADRREAIGQAAAAAAFLRKREPASPAPYLMLRGLRWGELRAAADLSDPTLLEAPPTEVRRHIKTLALNQKWKELLEAAEVVMAEPYSRAWLDLQRFVVEACVALGGSYRSIAVAIRSELKTLLRDVPQLLHASLMDDTPAANAETQAWLRELLQEPDGAAANTPVDEHPVSEEALRARWQKKFADSFQLAQEALRSGQEQKAFEILHREIERQRSGRGRFQRKLQLVELCASSGKEAIAQPILEDLMAQVENHKLDDWEDRDMLADALTTIMKASKKIQGDAKEKQKLFDRICRLDPVRAIKLG